MAVDRQVAVVHRITHGIAARERAPGPARAPAADAALRFELAPAGVTRAVVDLIDGLRPAAGAHPFGDVFPRPAVARSEEHTSELQSLMRISYAVFCLKKKKQRTKNNSTV